MNNDSNPDHIIVFGNNKDFDPQNPDTKIAPNALLINKSDEKYDIVINENIYPNNFGDAFKNIVVKKFYFTIELSNEIPDKYVSSKYITFKYYFQNTFKIIKKSIRKNAFLENRSLKFRQTCLLNKACANSNKA